MVHSSLNLTGKKALVTGSSRGIGRAIALALAEHGADVLVHGIAPEGPGAEVVKAIQAMGRKSAFIAADLAAEEAPQSVHDQAMATLGAVDILILNASVQIRNDWKLIPQAEYLTQMNVNFWASLALMQKFVPAMEAKGWGRVVTIGSVQQQRPHPQMVIYSASKMAQMGLVRSLAKQLAPSGITVNNVAPGVIDTDRNKDVLADAAYLQQVLAKIPVGFIGQVEDCTGAVLMLCGEAGRFTTGQDLLIDGGQSL